MRDIRDRSLPGECRNVSGSDPHARGAAPVYVGVVTNAGEPVWIGAAASHAELAGTLVEFLLSQSEYQLRDDVAAQFRELVDRGEAERAVALYFAHVGERWDRETLTIVRRTLSRVPDQA